MKILGIDIGNGLATCCLLEQKTSKAAAIKAEIYQEFKATPEGIKGILDIKAEAAILEPTGTNYSKLWCHKLTEAGLEVRLVGHKALKSYREHLQLPDKDDQLDSFALANYGHEYWEEPLRFVQIRKPQIQKIRVIVLRLQHLNRCKSPIINRLRQDLAWQFPEASKIKSQRTGLEPPLLWKWLAGEGNCTRYDNKLKGSCGLGLTNEAKMNAQRLCHIEREEALLEVELGKLIQSEEYKPYRKVFTEFGFGLRMQAILLSQCYPIENFLDENGSEIIEVAKGRKSGKPTKRYISLRRFQKCLGLAPTEMSSGDQKGRKVVGGSEISRNAFWQWVFTRIEVAKCRTTPILRELHAWANEAKRLGIPIKKKRILIAARACKILFRKLVLEVW